MPRSSLPRPAAALTGADAASSLREPTARALPYGLPHELGFGDVAWPAPDVSHAATRSGEAASPASLSVSRLDLAAYGGMHDAFASLAARALVANPFMSPAAVLASSIGFDPSDIIILAIRPIGQEDALVGAWVLRRTRDLWSGGAAVLEAPPRPLYECHSGPVLDAACAGEAMRALIDHIAASPDLPRLVRATAWPRSLDALLPHGAHLTPAESWQRAVLGPAPDVDAERYLKGAMGKALNKRRSKLVELGRLGVVATETARGHAAIPAFEDFMALEARGWKGRAGTAIALRPADRDYMRRMIAAFASRDTVALDRISLDGQPLAIGVMIESGPGNLFWKAAFDESHARFSPGALLHVAATQRLFREGRPSLDSGMMEFTTPANLPWSESTAMARVTIDCGSGLAGIGTRAGSALRFALRRLQRRMRGAKA